MNRTFMNSTFIVPRDKGTFKLSDIKVTLPDLNPKTENKFTRIESTLSDLSNQKKAPAPTTEIKGKPKYSSVQRLISTIPEDN